MYSPVARGCVHLQVAANVREIDEVGQAMLGSCVDFAGVFAQLRRNEIEAQLGVDVLLRRAGHRPLGLECGERVFVQRVAHLDGAAAKRDVVFLRSREIEQRGAVAFLFENANIHLHSTLQEKADFVLAVRELLRDFGARENVLRDGFDGFGFVFVRGDGYQEIEVAHGFLAAAQRARGSHSLNWFAEFANVGN